MGTYLCTGICIEMSIAKTRFRNFPEGIDINKIQSSMSKEFKLEMYDFVDEQSSLDWKLKTKYLDDVEDLTQFLFKQYMAYNPSLESTWKSIINIIKNAGNAIEVMKRAEEGLGDRFQIVEYIESCINYDRKSIYVPCKALGIFVDGKAGMECFTDIFRYFETQIHENNKEFNIAGAVKLWLTL